MERKRFGYQKIHEIYTTKLICYPVYLPMGKILHSSIKLLIHQLNSRIKKNQNILMNKNIPCNTLLNPKNKITRDKFIQMDLEINRIY